MESSCCHPTLEYKSAPTNMAHCVICGIFIDVRVKAKSKGERERDARLKIFSSWFKD